MNVERTNCDPNLDAEVSEEAGQQNDCGSTAARTTATARGDGEVREYPHGAKRGPETRRKPAKAVPKPEQTKSRQD